MILQVIVNQYGRKRRANWGPETVEGTLSEDELRANCHDQNVENAANRFLDDEYYSSRDFDLSDVEVPMLSVGNWGGILLHLRGNIEGFVNAGSKHKYLRLITGRHDLPFYTPECVEMQRSFLDAFLKGIDAEGWASDKPPKVGYKMRIGDVGFNDAVAEAAYPTRYEQAWPLPGTEYVMYFLTPSGKLSQEAGDKLATDEVLSYPALGSLKSPHLVQFVSEPFQVEQEFTGHVVAHLNVSVAADSTNSGGSHPSDIDLFVTIRHVDAGGKEIFYTGTVGDPVPVTKGWLRCSLRAVNDSHPRHTFWHPQREYRSVDHQPLTENQIYAVDVEVWPTNVVLSPGDRLVLEVSSGDTQGAGLFEHTSESDRPPEVFAGVNRIHFGPSHNNWLLMPSIPASTVT
jgi:predicted acyl esterase